jgi:GrpB-like predicted nucleotidyltransferase (UPF0157 family)
MAEDSNMCSMMSSEREDVDNPLRPPRAAHTLRFMDDSPTFSPILAYERLPALVRDHDQRAFAVAAHLARRITAARPGTAVEHIGSTAVAGLPGKGVIDLLVVAGAGAAAPDEVPSIVGTLLGLGFQPQDGPDPMPPERPLMVGAIDHNGERFRIHAHVVPAALPEAAELVGFRDALRADPAMQAAYTARKRAIVDGGTTDSREYSEIKGAWVRAELERLARLAGPAAGLDEVTEPGEALVPDQEALVPDQEGHPG